MRKIIEFICFLPRGIHVRPAVHLEKICRLYQSDIRFVNLRNKLEGSAKSILALMRTDTVLNDTCRLIIEGVDADSAFEALSSYIHDEFPNCDEVIDDVENEDLCLSPSLLRLAPNLLKGKGVSEGFAKGQLVRFESRPLSFFLDAKTTREFEAVREELLLVLMEKAARACEAEKAFLETQMAILHDPLFIEQIQARIDQDETLAKAIIFEVEAVCDLLAKSNSIYLKERATDLKDAGLQLLKAAHPAHPFANMNQLQSDSIVFAKSLTPSELLALERPFLKGIILANVGAGSHTLMLAKALNIPVVTEIDLDNSALIEGDLAFLDARFGFVIPSPSTSVINHFERAVWLVDQKDTEEKEVDSLPLALLNPITLDEKEIEISAISTSAVEAKKAFENGAKNIGLFTTDFFFIDKTEPPSEAEQFEIYRHLVKAAKGKAVTVSTLSFGFDKSIKYLNLPQEANPLLGYRAVRIYPQFLFLFHTQLRALLRAAFFGKIKILIPMIQSIEEIRWVKQQLLAVIEHLKTEGENYGEIKLGMLIEIPAVAFMMDLFSQEVDFFTIKADALAQYFHGVDKENDKVSALANFLSPAFLRLVSELVLTAHSNGKKISWCGDLLADNTALPLLVGMGLDAFTLATSEIKTTKEALAKLNSLHCEALFEQVKCCATLDEVVHLLTAFSLKQKQKPLFDPECVLLDCDFLSKEEAIQTLVGNLSLKGRTQMPVQLEADIWAHEDLCSTNLGKGFALSFVKSPHLLYSSVSLARLAEPVVWDNEKKEPVDFIIMLTMQTLVENLLKEQGEQNEQNGLDGSSLYNEQSDFFVNLVRKLTHEKFRSTLKQMGSEKEMILYLTNELGLYTQNN